MASKQAPVRKDSNVEAKQAAESIADTLCDELELDEVPTVAMCLRNNQGDAESYAKVFAGRYVEDFDAAKERRDACRDILGDTGSLQLKTSCPNGEVNTYFVFVIVD